MEYECAVNAHEEHFGKYMFQYELAGLDAYVHGESDTQQKQ